MKRITVSFFLFIIILFAVCFSACNSQEEWISINVSDEEINELQQQVNEGHRVGLLSWEQVTMEFLHSDSIEVESDYSKESTIISENDDGELIVEYALTNGGAIQLKVYQPLVKGIGGIYIVKEYRFI